MTTNRLYLRMNTCWPWRLPFQSGINTYMNEIVWLMLSETGTCYNHRCFSTSMIPGLLKDIKISQWPHSVCHHGALSAFPKSMVAPTPGFYSCLTSRRIESLLEALK